MKYTAIIPAAGAGTRLKPLTHTIPKPMVHVAGKPIIGHILDKMIGAVDTVVIVVGYMKDKLIDYVEKNYSDKFNLNFVEQKEQLGLGHSIWVTKDVILNSPVLIVLGDEIFERSYKELLNLCKNKEYAGSIGVKEVDNPSLYGIIELNEDGSIKKLIEKPEEPESNLAAAGVYIINNSKILFESLEEVVNTKGGHGGEYQLTDALQIMVDKGAKIDTFKISKWYDCGRPEMLLRVNKILLKNSCRMNGETENCVIINPVIIEKGCRINDSVIGPFVSMAPGSKVVNSIIKNSIIGMGSEIVEVLLRDSIVGAEAKVFGKGQRLYVGENAEIDMR